MKLPVATSTDKLHAKKNEKFNLSGIFNFKLKFNTSFLFSRLSLLKSQKSENKHAKKSKKKLELII